MPSSPFATLGLSAPLVATLTTLGYEEPTPVQRETIPLILEGKDLLAQAATGTGKTAAFALPMIENLAEGREKGEGGSKSHGVRAMVLVPTRELAMQVSEAIHKYGRSAGTCVVPLYGGASMEQQIRALKRGCDVVVATPGRALDHLRRETLVLDHLQLLVLDEADEMLDMGFAEDIDTILEATPDTRQTTLFSATMPARILSIAKRHLKNPQRVTIAHEKSVAGKLPRVRQVAYLVRRAQKPQVLDRILDMENPASAIVFCRTRLEVDELVETLNAHGYRAEALHGGMQQRQRDAVMNRVRAQKTDLLIATDVAARGLDIEHLSHVVNYDLPTDAESYVHRIGRTGRAGRTGTAITLAEPREHRLLKNIEYLTKQKIEIANVPTIADLRARRLELTRASVRERIVAGDSDDVKVVVEQLAEEFDLVEIAAAAIKMAHAALGGDAGEKEIDVASAPAAHHRDERRAGPAARSRQDEPGRPGRSRPTSPALRRGRDDDFDKVRLWIGAGRKAGIRPGDLVGAIAGESGLESSVIGAIEIRDNFSLVSVPELHADEIVAAMKKSTLRGQKVTIRRDRDEGGRG
jgi:ATP-dependent RNA helicase DeaD